jgi:hypothetical protein
VSIVTGWMSVNFYGYTVGSGDRSGTDVCIWLRTPFGWKTDFVSGNCVREARELIPWTMKTFDHRG